LSRRYARSLSLSASILPLAGHGADIDDAVKEGYCNLVLAIGRKALPVYRCCSCDKGYQHDVALTLLLKVFSAPTRIS
jgi:hypothetical protein